MKVQGFVTHAARNRRVAVELVLLYLFAFQILGGLGLSLFIVLFDAKHLPIADPVGYLLRYGIPVFLFSSLYLWFHYRRHARTIQRRLKIREVTSREEPRFVQVAEEQCIALGVRLPRFGIIEAPEKNALTVGEGPDRGLITVTRGLLDRLDDDELATVLSHEASHIRHGDTQLLALNHAMHRTTVSLTLEHPFRFDHWLSLVLIIIFPLLLPIFFAGSIATRLSMALSAHARRSLHLRRDYLADASAVRVTHNPGALISALRKVDAHGEFDGAIRVEGLLFVPGRSNQFADCPSVADRIADIQSLSGDLETIRQTRRDTRVRKFGIPVAAPPAAASPEPWRNYDAAGRPLASPPRLDLPIIKRFFAEPGLMDEWVDATTAYWEWRDSDRRNFLGVKPKMMIPLGVTLVFMGFFYWPADNNWRTLVDKMHPRHIVEYGEKYGINAEPICEGPSYPDGKCPGYD